MSATTAEVREAVAQAELAEAAFASTQPAATAFFAVRAILESVALPLAEERDALAAEVARLRADIELFQEMRAALVALGSRGQRGTTDELAAWTLARRLASEAGR